MRIFGNDLNKGLSYQVKYLCLQLLGKQMPKTFNLFHDFYLFCHKDKSLVLEFLDYIRISHKWTREDDK